MTAIKKKYSARIKSVLIPSVLDRKDSRVTRREYSNQRNC